MIKKLTSVFGIVLLLSFHAALANTERKEVQKPYNVLFIAIDDLNDWTGFLGGHPQTLTPHMDKLAGEGVVFEKAYCAAPVCNPSRAALLTGYRPSTTGVYGNEHFMRGSAVLQNARTIPQYFSDNGYFTTARGKIFHTANGKWADTASWNQFVKTVGEYGTPHKQSGMMASGIPKGEVDANFDWGPTDAKFEETQDYLTAQWAAGQFEKDFDKPFFIGCGIFRPHLVWQVPQQFFDKFPEEKMILPEVNESDYDDIPASALKPDRNYFATKKYGKQQAAIQAYLACINYADACVGVVLDALAKSKYADNTIVVLWGDHGWHLGEKLRYKKFTLWEEACRMPLIIKVPGVTKGQARCTSPVSLLDLYPTLVELCGLPANPANEGKSIVPLLKNSALVWDIPVVTTMGFNRHSVRNSKWRYTRYEDGAEELFNHETD
ncbi:MAG TPA: sulfatase, partial [Draconibacterium sp.]|nr:sulfatase [Draconibacterium sp.]